MIAQRLGWLLFLAFLVVPVQAKKEKSADTEKVAQMIVSGTNEFRKQEGRGRVVSNKVLADTALEFARFLSRSEKFGHDADGRRPHERAQQRGYEYCIVTENLALQFSSDGFRADDLTRAFLEGWERSPGHRKNLLNPDVTDIGVAIVRNSETNYYYAVQMFGLPQSAMIEFEVRNKAGLPAEYALGGRSFSLSPGDARVHRQCGSATLEIHWADRQRSAPVAPRHGERYAIVRGAAEMLQLRTE